MGAGEQRIAAAVMKVETEIRSLKDEAEKIRMLLGVLY